MNWLLHQLQKVLGAISGRRSHSRSVTSAQDDSDMTAAKEAGSASVDTPTSTQTGISFSIQPTEPSAQQSTVSPKDAIPRAVENANDTADTRMKLDAASFAVSGSQAELSDSEAELSDRSFSDESTADIQLADQLPSIHDLLPAVEQEIKANSTHFEEEAFAASDFATSDIELDVEVSDGVPSAPEDYDLDEPEQPVQALLFSFDITESASDTDTSSADTFSVDSRVEEDSPEGNITESLQLAFSPLESSNDEALPEAAATPPPEEAHDDIADQSLVDDTAAETKFDADAALPLEDNTNVAPNREAQPLKLDSTEDSQLASSNASASSVFDRASLPYPWSIATPKNAVSTEDEPVLQQEDTKQESIQTEKESPPERETVHPSSSNPAPTQPTQETNFITKNGVVKLLFTMKEGNFHGYIEPQDGTSDILFHQKYINEDIFASLERGVEVVVSVQYKEGKAYAVQVELAQ